MTRSFLPTVVVTVLLLAPAPSASAGELRGRLLLGDHPAAGVVLSAIPYEAPLDQARREARHIPLPQPLVTATTQPDGSFALKVPAAPGKERLFTVRAEGGGALAAVFGGVWEASENDDLGEHILLRGEELRGVVTDASGSPVVGAEVVLIPQLDRLEEPDLEPAPRRTTTGSDGAFRFHEAGATGNRLTVEMAGYLIAMKTAVKAGALARPIVLGKGVPVSGAVLKGDRKTPAAGALVRIEGQITTGWVETGKDGSFSIPNAPSGTVTLVADAGEVGYSEQAGIKLPLVPPKAMALILQPPSALVGRTLDARTGKPVPRAKIEVRSGAKVRAARSGPDGAYALRTLPPRSWQLRADEPRYVPWTRGIIPVRTGETKKLDIPLVLGAGLSGRVTEQTGKPVGGAKGWLVQLSGGPLMRIARFMRGLGSPTFRTQSDGTFKATRLPPGGNQILLVSHPDFQQATLGGLALVSGATKTGVTVVVKRGALITGIVKNAAGKEVPGAKVELTQTPGFPGGARAAAMGGASFGGPRGGERKGDTTESQGRFTIRGVAPGEYVLSVQREGYATARVDPVKVPETGSPASIEVTLGAGAVISGQVVHRSGAGAEGFVVSAGLPGRQRPGPGGGFGGGGGGRGGGGGGGGMTTDQPTGPDGAFTIEGLKVGQSYDLQLFGPSGPAEGKHGVEAPAADVRIVVAENGRIKGIALDAQSGRPLTDFQVLYEAENGPPRLAARSIAREVTGGNADGSAGGSGMPINVHSDDGSFALEDVPAGTLTVLVSAIGYQPARAGNIVVEEGGTRDGVEVRLTKSTALKGRVTNTQTGSGVPNAMVWLRPTGAQPALSALMTVTTAGEVTTDADGRFQIEGIGTGTQTVQVMHPDYADATASVDVKEDGSSVEIPMTPGSVLAGVVVSDAGQPVPGANVSLSQGGGGRPGIAAALGGQTGLTDNAGSFRFEHLGAGRYTLTASLGSHVSSPIDVVLQDGQSQENLSVQLQVGFTIMGTVTGLPAAMIGGMTVTANGSASYSQSTRLGTDGTFEFDNVPSGIVMLRGTATDSTGSTRSATRQVTVSADQPVLTAQLEFEQGLSLSGHVTQADQPVAGATVFAIPQGGGGRQASSDTDSAGGYQLNGLQEGTYIVNATSSLTGTRSSKTQTVALTSDQTLDIAFPSGKIEGQVVDANGKVPLANATVAIAPLDPGAMGRLGQRPTTTDSNGQFSFSNLDEGSYTLSTTRSDYLLDKRDATATDPVAGGLVIELNRGTGIGVKGLDGLFGVPLRGLMVRVFDTQDAPVLGPSPIALDSQGLGEIPALPPATYTVLAAASGYAPVRLEGVNVPSPTVLISLTPGGTILLKAGSSTIAAGSTAGTITTATGQPALLSLNNRDGRVTVSQPSLQIQHVAPGSYILSIPAVEFSSPITVTEGNTTIVQLP